MTEQLSEKELWNKAVNYLSRREHSRQELSVKLRSTDAERVDTVLDSLEESGFLSNRRFTESFVRMRVGQGHGLKRIRFDLQRKGIKDELLAEILDQLEIDWYELAVKLYERKYSAFLDESDYKEKSKRMRFMSQRGFSIDEIQHAISCVQSKSY
ncbi:MAG: regulatory protein RecX [Neptuniibacter sp.]